MKKRSSFAWTPAQVAAHCARTGQSNPLEQLGKFAEPHPDKNKIVVARRGRMNKTEASFARILDARCIRGEIKGYIFEGVRLAWGADPETGKAMHYCADFAVTYPDDSIKLIEVKGGHIFSRDLVRFKGCRSAWPQFRFEMHQKTRGEGWKRIH